MFQLLRDFWRGWSDADLASALAKITLHECNPGAVIYLTPREMRAHLAYVEENYRPGMAAL